MLAVLGLPTWKRHVLEGLFCNIQKDSAEHDRNRIVVNRELKSESSAWILYHPYFMDWRQSETARLLWMRADPGKGKTMLMIHIIKDLQSIPGSSPLSFFFCQAMDAKLNDATAVLRSLIYKLVHQQPILISHLHEAYDTGLRLFEGSNAFVAVSRVFLNMLNDPRLNQVYLLVDALDECQTELEQLLNFINETSAHPACQIMWLVSSRNQPNIEECLRPGEGTIQLDLEQDAEGQIADTVSAYVDHKASKLAQSKRYNNKLQTYVREYLRKNSSGTFLWVALVCKQLESTER